MVKLNAMDATLVNICPQDCIKMETDLEGFWYPEIDAGKCTKCNLCERRCPVINLKHNECESLQKAYVCYNMNDEIRMQNSSGGRLHKMS